MTAGRQVSDWGTDEIRFLRGVGPQRAARLGRLGVETIRDLLFHRPVRHLDRRALVPIAHLRSGEDATVAARVDHAKLRRPRGGGSLVVARLSDDSGSIDAVWFHQPYLLDRLKSGREILVSGPVRFRAGLQFVSPEIEIPGEGGSEEILGAGRLVPLYPLTEGISQRQIRRWIRDALDRVPADLSDPIPEEMRARWGFPPLSLAFRRLHCPEEPIEGERARRRLAFGEMLALQTHLLRARAMASAHTRARPLRISGASLEQIRASLPYRLTPGQESAVAEILTDIAGERPASRLLQGDVGSGKTAVAAIACAAAARAGSQSCFLAPMEILALQHASTLDSLLAPLGIRVGPLRGRMPAAERRAVLRGLEEGTLDLLVGTHAVLEPDVRFRRLGLVVVDEQHRFGVTQRLRIREKGEAPHTLVMSATPIPRSLALAFYGDLDITTIPDRPAGRPEVRTRLVDRSRWEDLLRYVAGRLRAGEQAFFVVPLVEESIDADLQDAIGLHREISEHAAFEGIEIGLLHGRLHPKEKESILVGLQSGAIRSVVSTTVVEVGLDLPQARIMVIPHPERFGLAQLHQLRGRIGRAPGAPAYLFLMRPETGSPAIDRLRYLVRETDGFRIAEEDLRRRGPGDLLGTRQAGLPRFRMADLAADADLIPAARDLAEAILRSDPRMERPEHEALWREAARAYPDGARLFGSG